jgi:hypothetical protein
MATRFYSSVEYGSSRGVTDPDVLYFNATVNNNNVSDGVGGEPDPQITASYQRTHPILGDANDYMVSVVRLATNGATRNLPILIPQIQESLAGLSWQASITGATMNVQQYPLPAIVPGNIISGSGTAILADNNANIIGQVPYVIANGLNGAPLTITNVPAPGSSTYGLSSTLPPAFFAGNNTYPAGNYVIQALVNATLFVGSAQADRDLTVYSFTLEDAGGNAQQVFVEWVTQEPTAQEPSVPVITQNIGNEYYYCYSYDWWVSLCNTALASAYLAIGEPGGAGNPPLLQYYTEPVGSLRFSFAPNGTNSFSTAASLGNCRLFMNSNMANLFNNFPGVWRNGTLGRTFECFASTNFIASPGGGVIGAGDSIQEFSSTSSWSPVDAICITTSVLPIISEQVTPPSLVGASDTGFNRGVSEAAFQPILLDVTLPEITGAEDWRSNFVYEPTGEYRMVSMTAQSTPISAIDFSGWWRNRLDDSLYPLRLSNGSSLSIKLMFRRKQMGV